MDWEVISAVATVIGTFLTFFSILIAVKADKQKRLVSNMPFQQPEPKQEPQIKAPLSNQDDVLSYLRKRNYKSRDYDLFEDTPYNAKPKPQPKPQPPYDPYAPFLYIAVGTIGACGGVASIIVPWLLLQASPEWEFVLYILLVTGFIGGIAIALIMDSSFSMENSAPHLRFPLAAISGVIGGWVGVAILIGWIIYEGNKS